MCVKNPQTEHFTPTDNGGGVGGITLKELFTLFHKTLEAFTVITAFVTNQPILRIHKECSVETLIIKETQFPDQKFINN